MVDPNDYQQKGERELITALPKTTEWKLDRTPNGGALKRIKNGEIQTLGSVAYSERFGLFLVTSFRYPHYRVEVEELEVAVDILWSWRTGYASDHHILCECEDCEAGRHGEKDAGEDGDL